MKISYSEAASELLKNTLVWTVSTSIILLILYFSNSPNLGFTKWTLAAPFITLNTLIILYKMLIDAIHIGNKKQEKQN